MAAPRYVLQALSEPASEPMSLADAKNYLRIDHNADDSLIASLIPAVRDAAEQYIGRSMISRNWRVIFEDYMPQKFTCPMGPALAITSVAAYDADTDSETIIDAGDYYLAPGFDRLCFIGMIYGDRITVDYTAGYGESASDVPRALISGMLIDLAARYGDREGARPMAESAKRAYAPYKTIRL